MNRQDYYVFVLTKDNNYFERHCSLTEQEAITLTKKLQLLSAVEQVDISLSVQEVYEEGLRNTYEAIRTDLGI